MLNICLHVTVVQVRVPGENDHFLLNPFGLLYHEITGSSLIKVDTKVSLTLRELFNEWQNAN